MAPDDTQRRCSGSLVLSPQLAEPGFLAIAFAVDIFIPTPSQSRQWAELHGGLALKLVRCSKRFVPRTTPRRLLLLLDGGTSPIVSLSCGLLQSRQVRSTLKLCQLDWPLQRLCSLPGYSFRGARRAGDLLGPSFPLRIPTTMYHHAE